MTLLEYWPYISPIVIILQAGLVWRLVFEMRILKRECNHIAGAYAKSLAMVSTLIEVVSDLPGGRERLRSRGWTFDGLEDLALSSNGESN